MSVRRSGPLGNSTTPRDELIPANAELRARESERVASLSVRSPMDYNKRGTLLMSSSDGEVRTQDLNQVPMPVLLREIPTLRVIDFTLRSENRKQWQEGKVTRAEDLEYSMVPEPSINEVDLPLLTREVNRRIRKRQHAVENNEMLAATSRSSVRHSP